MRNRKYNSKTLPKAWKKKKKSARNLNQKTHLLPSTKSKQLSQKKLTYIAGGNKPSTWKLPSILFAASLVIIILVIPTLIVLPYINHDGEQMKITTSEEKPESVEISAGDSPFSVAVMRSNTEKVENVPLETYVSRVVASEMPVDFELEALKAQALAARTNIVNLMLHQDQSNKPDVSDTTADQVYSNEAELREEMGAEYNENMNKINKAVAATKGQILTYKGAPIFPAFFSTSNGYTENSEDYWKNELPYLRSVKSPWDKASPKFLDQKVLSTEEVENLLGINITNQTAINMTRTDSNRVKQMEIAGKTFSGRNVREMLDLRSSDFSIEQKNGHFIFTTKGFGHGIGMSQYGANGMAKEGKNYKDIVKYYYQGIKISNIAETAPTLVAK